MRRSPRKGHSVVSRIWERMGNKIALNLYQANLRARETVNASTAMDIMIVAIPIHHHHEDRFVLLIGDHGLQWAMRLGRDHEFAHRRIVQMPRQHSMGSKRYQKGYALEKQTLDHDRNPSYIPCSLCLRSYALAVLLRILRALSWTCTTLTFD